MFVHLFALFTSLAFAAPSSAPAPAANANVKGAASPLVLYCKGNSKGEDLATHKISSFPVYSHYVVDLKAGKIWTEGVAQVAPQHATVGRSVLSRGPNGQWTSSYRSKPDGPQESAKANVILVGDRLDSFEVSGPAGTGMSKTKIKPCATGHLEILDKAGKTVAKFDSTEAPATEAEFTAALKSASSPSPTR